jgi:hypothetical protein
VGNGVHNDRKLGSTINDSVDRIIRSASVNDNSNKTPEEIEAEEEARRNGENVGAMAAAGVMVYDYLTSQSEPQDTAEDEDVGFTQSM